MTLDLRELSPDTGPISLGCRRRTQENWIQTQDPSELDLDAGPIALGPNDRPKRIGSRHKTHKNWILTHDM
jgi:hypothetical protein